MPILQSHHHCLSRAQHAQRQAENKGRPHEGMQPQGPGTVQRKNQDRRHDHDAEQKNKKYCWAIAGIGLG